MYPKEPSGHEAKSVTFEQVYESELQKVVRLATLIVGSTAVAEEAVQDAFLRLHEKWFEVRSPAGFLRTTVVNRCNDLRRRQTVSDRHLKLIETDHLNNAPNHYVLDALQTLDFRRRTIVVLRFYGDYKLQEIAEMMAIPEGTVNSNLRRGLAELKEALSQ